MKIVHYYTDPNSTGGPTTYIRTIMNSAYLNERFMFGTVYQRCGINSIRPKDIKRIIDEIKAKKPDVLHVHGLQGEGMVGVYCGKKAGVPTILLTVHGMINDSFNVGKFKRYIFKQIVEKWTLKNADATYCVCEATERNPYIVNNAKRLLPYLHNCTIDLPQYNREEERRKLGLLPNEIAIVSVGRITEGKGALALAEIIMHDSDPLHRYIVVGDGDKLNAIKQMLSHAGFAERVIFTGNVSDVGRYLSASDIYVSTSYKENLSISILEAGYYSLPSVVTNVGGNGEIIHSGYNGELFSPDDTVGFFKCLERIINGNMSEYANNAKQNIVDCYSLPVFEKGLEKIYDSLRVED